jgi:hypothetical protein
MACVRPVPPARFAHPPELGPVTLSRLSSRQEARTYPKFVDGASVMSVKAELGWPMMLGAAAAAKVRLIVWCKLCGHQVEPRWLLDTAPAPASSIGARAGAHPHHDLPQSGPRILSRAQHDPVNTAEAVDAIGFHLFLPPDCSR